MKDKDNTEDPPDNIRTYTPEDGMTIADYSKMWDVPVWQAHERLNTLFQEGVATISQKVVDGYTVAFYSINFDLAATKPAL